MDISAILIKAHFSIHEGENGCVNWRNRVTIFSVALGKNFESHRILQGFQTMHGKKEVRRFDVSEAREHSSCALTWHLLAYPPLSTDARVFILPF